MKLKMCTASKYFGKICLKTIRDTFFQHVVCNQRRDGVRHKRKGEDYIFWWGVKSNRRMRFKILGMSKRASWSPIKNILWSVLGLNTVRIFTRVRESIFYFKATYLQHVRLEMEKGWQNLWWCSIYIRLSIHLKIRSI